MRPLLLTSAAWLAANARPLVGLAALAAVSVGCALERPSLGLIAPGLYVLSLMTWAHIRGRWE
jgi:hypothetical protein